MHVSKARLTDTVKAVLAPGWLVRNRVGLTGLVIAELVGPKTNLLASGPKIRLKQRIEVPNLITQVGDQAYGDALAALHSNATVSEPAEPLAMQLGTGATAAAKTGGGAAIGSYISGSNQVFEATYPISSLNGSSRRIAWQSIWDPGDATNAAIAEVAVVTVADDDVASAAETVSRSVFGSTIDKQAGDTLTVTWYHDLLGA